MGPIDKLNNLLQIHKTNTANSNSIGSSTGSGVFESVKSGVQASEKETSFSLEQFNSLLTSSTNPLLSKFAQTELNRSSVLGQGLGSLREKFDSLIDAIDTDSNGMFSADELGLANQAFSLLDVNSDGLVSKQEMYDRIAELEETLPKLDTLTLNDKAESEVDNPIKRLYSQDNFQQDSELDQLF